MSSGTLIHHALSARPVLLYALSAPAHVDLTQIEIMPTQQVMGGADFLRDR